MTGIPQHGTLERANRLKTSPALCLSILMLVSLALTALPVRAASPIASPDRYTVDEDSLDNRLNVLDNDDDPDGDTLKIFAVTQGDNGGKVRIIDGGDRVSYEPAPNFDGDDSFTYYVNDGRGGTDSAQVDVTVRGINDPPTALDDEATTDEDNPVTVDVLANDEDTEGVPDPSTVKRISGPSHGSVSINNSTGEITYSPANDWYGADTFTYEVCDNGMPLPPRCDTATVSITVREVNDRPISDAGPDQNAKTNAVVTLDGSRSIDLEGDLPLTYSWSQTGGPPVILDNPSGQTTTFTTPDDPCIVTLTLRVFDARGLASAVPDEILVTVTNRAPVANAGTDQNVLTDAVVQLDGAKSSDPDNDYPLTYLWVKTSGPTVSLSNNSVATPTFSAPGTPTVLMFTLYVWDDYDELSLDTVKITVDKRPTIYLPLLFRPIVGPDLVVQSIQATRNNVRVTIRNQGNVPIQNGFFVDVYINPSSAPTRVNQTWLDLSKQGMVWGVKGSALQALVPGASIALEYRDSYYLAEYSSFSGSLAPGTPIYAQVDSFNDPDTGYGTVQETHEMLGKPYNNVLGPVYSTAALSSHPLSLHPTDPGWNTGSSGQDIKSALDSLPVRP